MIARLLTPFLIGALLLVDIGCHRTIERTMITHELSEIEQSDDETTVVSMRLHDGRVVIFDDDGGRWRSIDSIPASWQIVGYDTAGRLTEAGGDEIVEARVEIREINVVGTTIIATIVVGVFGTFAALSSIGIGH